MEQTAEATLTEHNEQIAGTQTFWRSTPVADGQTPVLFVHGVPSNSDVWVPFLEKTGGVALDLPGFARSEKPNLFDYSIAGYNSFLQAFIGRMGWDRFSLVVHDWGSLALVTAAELHDRVDRVVIMNAVPLSDEYRWHRIARIWRVPVLGEIAMGATTETMLRYASKESRPSGEPLPKAMMDSIWEHFDHGTQRSILRLYRAGSPRMLGKAGENLSQISAPTLVLWGEHDPYVDGRFGELFANTLPNATLKTVPDAGHWPWVDQPSVVDDVTEFLSAGNPSV